MQGLHERFVRQTASATLTPNFLQFFLCRDGRIEHEGTPGVTPTACDFQGDGGESHGRFRGCLHGLKALESLGVALNLMRIPKKTDSVG